MINQILVIKIILFTGIGTRFEQYKDIYFLQLIFSYDDLKVKVLLQNL